MNPKHYEFLAQDRIAEMARNVAGDQVMARARDQAQTATSSAERPGWTARASHSRSLKLGRMIAWFGGG